MQAFNQRLWGFYTSSRNHFTFATETFTEGKRKLKPRGFSLLEASVLDPDSALRVLKCLESFTDICLEKSMNQWLQRYLLVQWNQIQRTSLVVRSTVKVWISQQSPFGLPQTLTHVPLYNFHSTITKLLLAFDAKKTLPRSRGRKETPAKHLQNSGAARWSQPLELKVLP